MPRSEKISWPAPGFSKGCRPCGDRCVRRLRPDAEGVRDESVELVSDFIALRRIDQAQVDRGVSAVGDDREQDIVTGLRRAVAFLDRGDALIEQALVRLEGRASAPR